MALKKRSLVVFLPVGGEDPRKLGCGGRVMSLAALAAARDLPDRDRAAGAPWENQPTVARSPGTTIFVDLKQSTPPAAIPDIWYQVRKNIGDMRHIAADGVLGPSSTMTSATLSASSTASPPTDVSALRAACDYVEDARSRLLQVPDVSKIEVLGRRTSRFIEFSTERLAGSACA